MGFLQKLDTPALAEQRDRGRTDAAALPKTVGTRKKSTSRERPKTAEDKRSRSFSRPRTATGVTTNRSSDLQFLNQTIEIRAGNETFNFPTPSPKLPPKSATFKISSSRLKEWDSPAIGVALGSPSQAAMPKWGRSHTAEPMVTRSHIPPLPTRAAPELPTQVAEDVPKVGLQRKTSTWRKLGGFFARKAPKPTIEEPFYKLKPSQDYQRDPGSSQLQPPRAATTTPSPSHSPLPQRSPSNPAPVLRSPSMTRSRARLEARAEAETATFNRAGKPKKWRSPSMIQKEGFSPMFRALNDTRDSEDMFRPQEQERTDSPLSMNERRAMGISPSTPKLDLDLPDPNFERYSVMFGKVLDQPKPKQSLLERRQSRLSKRRDLKPLDSISSVSEEGIVAQQSCGIPIPQRSMTSPFLKKSLSIDVRKKAGNNFAAAADYMNHINRPRPIQRSKTTPTKASSPLVQSFAKARAAILGRSPRSPAYIEEEIPPTPVTFATVSDSGSIPVIKDDSVELKRSMEQTEPSWDMMTSKPAKIESADRSDPYLRVKSPADLERQIVQVSVARQVSVSKARQQVQQAVASKQPLRPRIVNLSKDRKSTVVLIETDEGEVYPA